MTAWFIGSVRAEASDGSCEGGGRSSSIPNTSPTADGFSLRETEYKNTQGSVRHLVLMVEESVDAGSGAGVPNLHTLVGRAEGSTAEKTPS